MSVRDPKAPIRRQAVRRHDARPQPFGERPRRGPGVSQVLVVLLFVVFLIGTAGFVVAALSPAPDRSPRPTDVAALPSSSLGVTQAPSAGTSSPTGQPAPTGVAPTPSAPSATPVGSPAPTGTPGGVDTLMPIVPVVGFWNTDPGLSRSELVEALEGRSARYQTVYVPDSDRDAIAGALGITMAASVQGGDPQQISRSLSDGGLALLRASDATPRVRALSLEGRELFGNDRVDANADWPLTITASEPPNRAWDQASTIVVVAGGDSLMDRGIYERVVNRNKGLDHPFDGGTVEITGRYCCGPFTGLGNYEVPSFRGTGNDGIVRRLVMDADLTMINLENPVPDNWVFHVHGLPFSGAPELLEIWTRVDIDWLGLANNHIGDYGAAGIADTVKHLGRFDLDYAGAGEDLEAARRYSVLDAGPGRVALLPCVAIEPNVWAGPNSAGAMPCNDPELVPNIRRAVDEADAVIVFPSWGPEYTPYPVDSQRELAQAWLDAGADVVVGFGHHSVAGMEDFDGKLAMYSIGNFVFDQNWAEMTMEGIAPEMTFHGGEMVQVRLNPFLTIDQSQPNLLDPATDGQAVYRRIERGSRGLLDY